MKASIIAGAAVTAALIGAGAAVADSVTVSASATIQYPAFTLNTTSPMAFGNVVTSTADGTVTLGTNGSASFNGGVTSGGGTTSPGAFTYSGQIHNSVSVTIPESFTLAGGGGPLTVDTLTLNANSGVSRNGSTYTVTAPTSSAITVTIGGSLHVPAGQTAGDYTGTFDVTVNNA